MWSRLNVNSAHHIQHGRADLNFSVVHVFGLFRAGELFAFGYNVGAQPHCTYCVIDPKGDLMLDVPIHLPK